MNYNVSEPYTVNNIPVVEPMYEQAYPLDSPVAAPGKSKAVASMVFGIISIILSFTGAIGLGCGIAALVFSAKAKKAAFAARIIPGSEQKAGFICGVIGTVISSVFFVIGIIKLVTFFGMISAAFSALAL